MAEIQLKRHREEEQQPQDPDFNPSTKRQNTYDPILSLLDEEGDETDTSPEPPTEDLSAIFTTFQQELSSSTSCDSTAFDDFDFVPSDVCSPRSGDGEGEDEGAKSVMRHLLEASDDELGIPNREEDDVVGFQSGEDFPFAFTDHGLWELEDETANYYTVMQSELFM